MHRLDTFPTEEIIQHYRALAMNKSFPVVFGHMLFELGMFIEVPESAEDAALKNYATRLLRIFGGGEVKELTIQNLLKNLVGQSLSDDRETNNKEG